MNAVIITITTAQNLLRGTALHIKLYWNCVLFQYNLIWMRGAARPILSCVIVYNKCIHHGNTFIGECLNFEKVEKALRNLQKVENFRKSERKDAKNH